MRHSIGLGTETVPFIKAARDMIFLCTMEFKMSGIERFRAIDQCRSRSSRLPFGRNEQLVYEIRI